MVVSVLCCLLLGEMVFQTNGITCEDVHEKGSGSAFKPEELSTLSSLSEVDLKTCTVLLGIDQLSSNQSHSIWSSFVQVYGGAENIPEDQLQQLGWVINGIPPAHFLNISLTDIDTISSLGRCELLGSDQLENLKNAIADQWLGKNVEDFTSLDLVALRQILCAYNITALQMIHPDAYKDAASELGTLTNCPPEVIKELAQLATNEKAFGDPAAWTSVQMSNVGCVMAGLPTITDVPADAFEGITADIIRCLPVEAFQVMTSAQISKLSPSAATALSRKSIALSSEKRYALQLAVAGEGESKKSESPKSMTVQLQMIAVVVLHYLFVSVLGSV